MYINKILCFVRYKLKAQLTKNKNKNNCRKHPKQNYNRAEGLPGTRILLLS